MIFYSFRCRTRRKTCLSAGKETLIIDLHPRKLAEVQKASLPCYTFFLPIMDLLMQAPNHNVSLYFCIGNLFSVPGGTVSALAPGAITASTVTTITRMTGSNCRWGLVLLVVCKGNAEQNTIHRSISCAGPEEVGRVGCADRDGWGRRGGGI